MEGEAALMTLLVAEDVKESLRSRLTPVARPTVLGFSVVVSPHLPAGAWVLQDAAGNALKMHCPQRDEAR